MRWHVIYFFLSMALQFALCMLWTLQVLGCFSVSGVLFLPHLVLLKQSTLANAFAEVVRFLTPHHRTLHSVLHRQQKWQIELSDNFRQHGCSQYWARETICSPSLITSTPACLTWVWDSWVTYFGKSNWMHSILLPSPNLSTTASGLHFFKRPEFCKTLSNLVLLPNLAECLRLSALTFSRTLLKRGSLEAKSLLLFLNSRLACSALNTAERRPSLHLCLVLWCYPALCLIRQYNFCVVCSFQISTLSCNESQILFIYRKHLPHPATVRSSTL